MCERIYDFKLCTCVGDAQTNLHAKGSKKDKKKAKETAPVEYNWQLLRYVETKETGMIGRIIMPSHDIGAGLTEDFVWLKLNLSNCFDFEYAPQESDTLSISIKGKVGTYLSFVYQGSEWKPGIGYDAFSDILEDIGRGKLVKIIPDAKKSQSHE